MIITNSIARHNLGNYSNKNNKITRDIKNGKLFKIAKGLYETNLNTPGYLLAGSILGPSYISFEFALSFYGLIPERVSTITCASFNKKKKKMYINKFGTFSYRDIPILAYPEEIYFITEGDYIYQIASREKALCDKLYTLGPIKNYDNLERMLFSDLRIDIEEFNKLNILKVEKLSKLYDSTNVILLAKYMRRIKNA